VILISFVVISTLSDSPLEKNKNVCPNMFSSIFNAFINVHELREIFILGGSYTVSNNQKNPTLEKLDRALMTREWEILFPATHVYKIPRVVSDHNPLMLSTHQNTSFKLRDFRFELVWLKDTEFLVKVKKIWEEPIRDTNALDRV
jgi:hypothetical protein